MCSTSSVLKSTPIPITVAWMPFCAFFSIMPNSPNSLTRSVLGIASVRNIILLSYSSGSASRTASKSDVPALIPASMFVPPSAWMARMFFFSRSRSAAPMLSSGFATCAVLSKSTMPSLSSSPR